MFEGSLSLLCLLQVREEGRAGTESGPLELAVGAVSMQNAGLCQTGSC